MNMNTLTPVVGRKANGDTVWYTGKAGEAFISPDPTDAFLYDTVEAARRRAMNLNRMTELHGVRFVVVTGDEYLNAIG